MAEGEASVGPRYQEWPEAGSLASLMDENKVCRRRLLSKDDGFQLTRWPSNKTVGIGSVAAMALNAETLLVMAKWWCAWQPSAVYIPIDLLKREVLYDKTSPPI